MAFWTKLKRFLPPRKILARITAATIVLICVVAFFTNRSQEADRVSSINELLMADNDFHGTPSRTESADPDLVAIDETELAVWFRTQIMRRGRIDKFCKDMGTAPPASGAPVSAITRHMLVESRHKGIFCRIPKVASTSWSFALAAIQSQRSADELRQHKSRNHLLLHNAKHLEVYGVTHLHVAPPSDQKTMLKVYPKFLFVRHPFQRLVSAYVDKFRSPWPENVFVKINRYIIDNYRTNSQQQASPQRQNATFAEFLNYVLEGRQNPHWAPAATLCNPCQMKYDYIGKLESIPRDARYILQQMFESKSSEYFIVGNPTAAQNTTDTKYHYTFPDYFKGVPRQKVAKLYQIYKDDFKLFGYTHDLY